MSGKGSIEAMADAVLIAGRLVKDHGSPALWQAMRVVLFILGREIAALSNSIGTGPRIGFQSGPLRERGATPLVSPAKPVGVAQPG